ncbi:MAG: ABC transporter permease [Pseudobdellovibrionaceae bacterium]
MLSVLLKRLAVMIPTLFGASLLSFFLLRMIPGDPVMTLLGERGGSPELYAELNAKLGFDKPLPMQYGLFVKNALLGDFGDSVVSQRPVSEEFWTRMPATLELGAVALIVATLLGIPLGLIAAIKRNSIFDYGIMGTSLIGYSMPIFWWGMILILFFSIQLGLTPVSGRIDVFFDVPPKTGFLLIDSLLGSEPWPAFKSALAHLVLPVIALGTIPLAVIVRMTRSSLLEVLGEDYIRTAKAKGLFPKRIYFVHALRNAAIPIVTIIGLLVGSIVTGAVLTETIFSWPGIGRWLVKSVEARDYPVIQAAILYITILIMFINLFTDLLNMWANPKLRATK